MAPPTVTDLPPTATVTATATASLTPEPTATPEPTNQPNAADLIPAALLSNLNYSGLLGGESVALRNGRYLTAPGSTITITMSDKIAFGYIEGRPFAAVVLISEGEEIGAQYSLHIVGLQDGRPVEVAYTPLEDAGWIDSVMIAFDQIAAELVTTGPLDSSCCPSQLVVQLFKLEGNSLKRTANEVVGVLPESEQNELIAAATSEGLQIRSESYDEGAPAPQAADTPTPQAEATPTSESTPQAEATPGGEDLGEASAAAEETSVSTALPIAIEADLSLPPGMQPGSVLELTENGVDITTTGLVSGWYWRARPERTTPREPETQIYPEHVMIVFGEDNIVDVAAHNGRRLLIFPLHNTLEFNTENGLSGAEEQIVRLQTLIAGADERDEDPQGEMPLLPQADSPVTAWSHFSDLDFAGGRGVRYIWEADVDRYIYQGLTEDGRYYVSLFWPLDAGYDESLIGQLDGMVATLDLGL